MPLEMDTLDKAILNRIQSRFPLTSRPYESIAKAIGTSENEVLERVKQLKEKGIIRRIGGNFVPGKVGFVSTLCAASVEKDKIESFADAVNGFPGVTHNYIRDHRVNIWFTFISPSMKEIERNLKQISDETGVQGILNLPATKVFKIKAKFDL